MLDIDAKNELDKIKEHLKAAGRSSTTRSDAVRELFADYESKHVLLKRVMENGKIVNVVKQDG